MLRSIDYQRVFSLIDVISLMPKSCALADILSQFFESIDLKSKVQNNALYKWVSSQNELKKYLSEPNDQQTDLDIFFYLYTHVVLKKTVTNFESLDEIDHLLSSGSLNISNRSILTELKSVITSYLIKTGILFWKKLSE